MAMIEFVRKAPFGAETIYRLTAGVYSVAESIRIWRAKRQTEAEFLKLSRAQLDDIGVALGDVIQDQPSPLDRVAAWFQDWRDTARTADALGRLSARQLDDIGVTQGDVADYRRQAGWL